MTAELHINVGIVALARGFINLETFASGMRALAGGAAMSVRDLWLGPGRLDESQLQAVLEVIGPAPDPRRAAGRRNGFAEPDEVTHHGERAAARGPVLLLGHPISPAFESTASTHVVEVAAVGPYDPVDGGDDTRPGTLRPPTQPPPFGELVGGRYQRLSSIGSGGLGEVLACADRVLGRTVAVKASHQKADLDQKSSNLILAREARIISCLEHPNIIPIYDAGTDRNRGPFYVMRQVSQTSLEVLLRRRRKRDGDPREYTLGRLLRYFLQVCNAVDYAHSRGVIHCDIKPANILLGAYGEVLLVDWGLAQSRDHPLRIRGGTYGYMAPEQMDPSIERVDARADVFALGSILYEILCGAQAFPDVSATGLTEPGIGSYAFYQAPVPPTAVAAGDEPVPPEAEEICLRAIAIDRERRLASARLLADAIDELIEGTKQRELRRIEADRGADAGDELAERYHEFSESRPEKLAVVRTLRADIVPWAPATDKNDLWDAEDVVRITDALQVRTFHSAVSAYERALDAVPGHVRARRGLARLYWAELQRARHRGHALDEVAYEQLLRDVDDGTFIRELQRDGALELVIGALASQVTLSALVERDRRLIAVPVEMIVDRPRAHRSLPAGRYVVSATIGGAEAVSWPVAIEPGSSCQLGIETPGLTASLEPDEVVIPGGLARLGGDPLSTESDDPLLVEIPTFVLQRYPLTFAHWFAFLDDLRRIDPGQVEAHLPCTTRGGPIWRWTGATWILDANVPVAPTTDPLQLPAFGINAESAESYARWRSARDGRAWRLPTELEWEKAGRGPIGLIYPWGEHFDATFCKMRDSRSGAPRPEPVGAFAGDLSPYGVRDLAGGVADWCTPDPRRSSPREPREVVSRGGAWCDWSIDCRLASRRRYLATEHTARVGVRLARDP